MSKDITILTDPIICIHSNIKYSLKRVYLLAKECIRITGENKYRGHFAVTRSLANGFELNNINYNYNPVGLSGLGRVVIVLAGVDTLRQSIDLKRRGYIDKIFAGPNIVEFSSDAENILTSNEINLILTPSIWVTNLYCKDNKILKNKCYSWPAGVDFEYWNPQNCISKKNKEKKILIYCKSKKDNILKLIDSVDKFLRKNGFETKILEYGLYSHTEFWNELCSSSLLIGFTNGSESQGIAWVESWSMDVPTLIYQNDIQNYRGKKFECSTAPYLTSDNGSFFIDYDDFKRKFIEWKKGKKAYKARSWVEKNMTDSVCSLKLYRRIERD
jgi:hypothetical protein